MDLEEGGREETKRQRRVAQGVLAELVMWHISQQEGAID
jgi:hypothetical protein